MFSKNKNRTIKRIASIFSLSVFLIGFAPQTIFAGNFFSTPKKYDNPDLNSIEVDTLTDAEVNSLIDKEKNEYVNRAPDIFEFDDTLIEKIDHKILLLSLIKLNYLFEKYSGFTKSFIDYRRKIDLKFKLGVDMDERASMTTGFSGIYFCSIRELSYKWAIFYGRINIIFKFHPYCDSQCLVDSIITHEFGHLIEHMYMESKGIIKWETFAQVEKLKSLEDNINNEKSLEDDINNEKSLEDNISKEKSLEDNISKEKSWGYDIEKLKLEINKLNEDTIKINNKIKSLEDKNNKLRSRINTFDNRINTLDNIIELGKKFSNGIQNEILEGLEDKNRIISTYGGTNAEEFFAEAFAHLECTNNPDDVNEIGRRLENYLVNVMEYLPRENSKFNK